MDKLKILMLTRGMPAHGPGGMERHTSGLASYLAREGHEVTIVTTAHPDRMNERRSKPNYEKVEDNYQIVYLPNTSPCQYTGGWWKAVVRYMKDLQERYDIVHSQSAAITSVVKQARETIEGTPLIVTMHGTAPMEIATAKKMLTHGLKPMITSLHTIARMNYAFLALDKYYLERADVIIAVSNSVRMSLERHYERYIDNIKNKIHVVNHGIDTSLYKNGKIERYSNSIVLYVGRIEREKGIDIIMDVARRMKASSKSVQFVAIGGGGYLDDARNRRSDVEFRGFVPEDDVRTGYSEASIFIMPSIREEGMPSVLLEAMASGLPIVVSDLPGMHEILKEDYTKFLPSTNVKVWTNTISSMLEKPDILAKMGARARKEACAKYDIEAMGKKTLEIYQKTLKGIQ